MPSFFEHDGEGLDPFCSATEAEVRQVDGRLVLSIGGQHVISDLDDDETLRAVASRIELALVAQLTSHVVLHAGVVDIAGRAVLLPGSSMAGKSTLVRALVDAGAQYLSDEFALIDADGLVSPYPRPLTIRGTDQRMRTRIVPTRTASPSKSPIPVALVADLQWRREGGWSVTDSTPSTAVLAMLRNGVNVQHRAGETLTALGAVAGRARAVSGVRGPAAEAASAIEIMMAKAGAA